MNKYIYKFTSKCYLICMDLNNDEFNTLRKISDKKEISQRKLAENLGFSLGKLNYCIQALKEKGLIKLQNFKNNKKKMGYVYKLTPSGISHKLNLTINYMKIKMKEYDQLKKEYEEIKNKTNQLNVKK